MCGNGLIAMTAALRQTVPTSPAAILLAHLGLETRTTAEIEDLYSRPIPTDIVPLVTGEHRVPQVPAVAGDDGNREAA